MRVVFDTSVLISAMRSKDGASNALLKSLPHPRIQPCFSVALYAERQEVLCRREHLPTGKTASGARAFLRYLASLCHHQDVHFLWRPFLKCGNIFG